MSRERHGCAHMSCVGRQLVTAGALGSTATMTLERKRKRELDEKVCIELENLTTRFKRNLLLHGLLQSLSQQAVNRVPHAPARPPANGEKNRWRRKTRHQRLLGLKFFCSSRSLCYDDGGNDDDAS